MKTKMIRYAIQCKDLNTNTIGSFAYDESITPSGNIGFYAVSPVFSDLVDFYQWAHSEGYKTMPGCLDNIMFYA